MPQRPYFPEGRGFIERMNGFLETSFLPLRRFASIADLQAQADQWTVQVADRRRVRRIDAVVADALAVERGWLRRPPAAWPDVEQRLEVRASSDSFVRVGGVDYSVPPRFAGRRLSVRAGLGQVRVFCDGEPIATNDRSWARADVVLAPAHARQLRQPREAQRQLDAGDIAVDPANLPAYDELTG